MDDESKRALTPRAPVVARHAPSDRDCEADKQADGRFFIQGMRVGGPYKATASLQGFSPDVQNDITLSLGVTQDLDFSLKPAGVAESVVVVGVADPVFSTTRSGAATAVTREDLAALP